MIEIILKNIATSYYPLNLDPQSNYDEYINSYEHNNLINKLDLVFSMTEQTNFKIKLLNEFKKNQKFKNIKDYTADHIDKCLTFKVEIVEENILYQICINISVIVPYYIIYVLKNNITLKPYKWIDIPKRDIDSEINKFEEHIFLLRGIIERETHTNAFPNYLINKTIPEISYTDIEIGNYTFFNAFFIDDLTL